MRLKREHMGPYHYEQSPIIKGGYMLFHGQPIGRGDSDPLGGETGSGLLQINHSEIKTVRQILVWKFVILRAFGTPILVKVK